MIHENEMEKLLGTVELIKDDELTRVLTNMIEERKKFKELVKNTPNDMDLGKVIRSHFRQ